MSEALTRSQLRTAQGMLRQGNTLHSIADWLGVSYEAVCLGLFGGNVPQSPDTDRRLSTADAGRQSAVPLRAERERPGEDVTAGETAPRLHSHDAESDPPGVVRASPSPAAAFECDEPTDASLKPGKRYRLVSEHGESLHKNERVLTRLPKFFWRGDADAVAALQARRPQWAHLEAREVLG